MRFTKRRSSEFLALDFLSVYIFRTNDKVMVIACFSYNMDIFWSYILLGRFVIRLSLL